MRIRDPKTTALIFASGKMVVTGAKSEDDSRLASRKYARIVQKLGFDAKFLDFKIQNIVGSCDVKFPIRLEGLAYSHGSFSSYEPEVSRTAGRFVPFASLNAFITCLVAISLLALPRLDIPHDQAESRFTHLCVRQDCVDWRKGDAVLGRQLDLAHLLVHWQVREEIYTAFNTIYTVLVEFRKP